MFFQGSLQEGINTALQEAKLVVCFVTGPYLRPLVTFLPYTVRHFTNARQLDGETESQLWENEFLTDESV